MAANHSGLSCSELLGRGVGVAVFLNARGYNTVISFDEVEFHVVLRRSQTNVIGSA
jgi:hypothetical protein